MYCHYCLAKAALEVEKDGVKIGLCETHLEQKVSNFEIQITNDELEDFI